MLQVILTVMLLAGTVHVKGTMVYGRCPFLKAIRFEPFLIRYFEGDNGQILYFSNVRFEALFDEKLQIEEHYISKYVIVLEHKEDCFQPFQLQLRGIQIPALPGSDKRGSTTILNTTILGLHEKDYLLAFSCVQVGHNKLEYVWIFGRAGRFSIGPEKVRKLFGDLLANMSTDVKDLRRSHHDLPFCTSILWPAIFYGSGGILLLLVMTAGIVCWKKHKQIIQLRRQSCAECEYPSQELEQTEVERNVTSAKTIAIMHGAII
uniref:Uncharacterized protein n=1 Tax=Anopheles funestus TaxID=62324 RepID=A0A182RAL0_ANOFN